MIDYRNILRLHGEGHSQRAMERELYCSRHTMIISRQGKRGYAPRKAPIRFKESSNPQRGKRLYAIGKHRRNSTRKLFLDSEPEAKRSHRRRRHALGGF